ncbi:hypothetical protein LguiB_022665 [Lonicera macranthoides]
MGDDKVNKRLRGGAVVDLVMRTVLAPLGDTIGDSGGVGGGGGGSGGGRGLSLYHSIHLIQYKSLSLVSLNKTLRSERQRNLEERRHSSTGREGKLHYDSRDECYHLKLTENILNRRD